MKGYIKMSEAKNLLEEAKKNGWKATTYRNLYCVKDLDMGFGSLQEAPNHMIALRGFSDACQKEESFIKYPEKYELWYIGMQNADTGEITMNMTKLAEARAYAPEKKA